MSLKNLGLILCPLVHTVLPLSLYVPKSLLLVFLVLNPGPMVHTISPLLLYALEITLLAFWGLNFSLQHESSPKVVKSFQYFCAQIGVWYVPFKFKNQFYSFLHYSLIFSHRVSNRCALSYIIICHDPIGDTRWPSDSGNGAPYTGSFIQCVDGRETTSHELWCHGIDRICREAHPKRK